ncbi:putative reverse transcriptase zinc-binding domain-containing protein [Helianthus debilis subsp. tardiflorus]
MKNFLWGGSGDTRKMHWVAWSTVASPKSKGGLGVARLVDCNRAFLCKWLWRYVNEKKGMWKEVVKAIHFTRRWEPFMYRSDLASSWSKIVKETNKVKVNGVAFSQLLKCKAGKGDNVRFWLDHWLDNGCLKDSFPDLFRLENNKLCTMEDRLWLGSVNCQLTPIWSWQQPPSSASEVESLQQVLDLLQVRLLQQVDDCWRWEGDPNGIFSVAAVRSWLTAVNMPTSGASFDWCKWVPSKCNIFMWRVVMNRIPTKQALSRRNIFVEDNLCVLCEDGEETVEHLFSACGVSTKAWEGIARWCGIPSFIFSLADLMELHKLETLSNPLKEIIKGVVIIFCWRVWKARNEKIFEHKNFSIAEIVERKG